MKEESIIESTQPKNNNSNKGLKIATVVMSILALAGVGIGIYGMLQSSDKDHQISDLKVQIKNSNGTTTTLETPEVSTTTEDGTTVTISDSATTLGLSPVVISSSINNNKNAYYLSAERHFFSDGNLNKSWMMVSLDGEVTMCRILENGSLIEECNVSAHSGKIANIYDVILGNGGVSNYVLVLTDTGEIEYLTDTEGDYRTLKRLNLPKKVAQIITNVETTGKDENGNILGGGGRTTLIVYTDGEIVDFSNVINQ